jgi:hypothetical protein
VDGSFTTIVARFFHTDKVTFNVTTTAAQAIPNVRTYHRFSDLADDVVDARVYMGIHFRFADTAARWEGTRVATQAFNHFLRPSAIAATIMTRSASTTIRTTTGMIVMVVAATGSPTHGG